MWLELRLFLVALNTLTRCPLPAWVGWQPAWRQQSLHHFPGVGLVVGAGAALVLWLAGHAWPALVSVLTSIAFTLWLTQARHESGWALVCTLRSQAGLDPAVVPRPGSGAVEGGSLPPTSPPALDTSAFLGLLLMVALKVAALHGLVVRDLTVMLATLALAHSWSRCGMVLLLWWRRRGQGVPRDGVPAGASTSQPASAGIPVALLWAAIAAGMASLFVPAMALAVAAAASVAVGVLLAQRLQSRPAGRAASGLDALQQVCELVVYLAVLATLAQG